MLTNDGLIKHEKLCNERVEEMTDYLVLGKCQDFAEYKNLVGKIHGVIMSREILEDVKRTFEDEDDV